MSEPDPRTERAKSLASRNRDLEAEISRLLSAAAKVEIDHAEATRIAAEAYMAAASQSSSPSASKGVTIAERTRPK